jgi:hypothetical protein
VLRGGSREHFALEASYPRGNPPLVVVERPMARETGCTGLKKRYHNIPLDLLSDVSLIKEEVLMYIRGTNILASILVPLIYMYKECKSEVEYAAVGDHADNTSTVHSLLAKFVC